jgi:hypothetical protein
MKKPLLTLLFSSSLIFQWVLLEWLEECHLLTLHGLIMVQVE